MSSASREFVTIALRVSSCGLRRTARGRLQSIPPSCHLAASRRFSPLPRSPIYCASPRPLRPILSRSSSLSSVSAGPMTGTGGPSADGTPLDAAMEAPPTEDLAPVAENETPAADDATMDAVQKRLMFDDECILVDENDNVVGHDSKYKCHLMETILSGQALHRAFSVFLFNSKYELLLQQRSQTKVTFPLVWTNTCCSHPLYRESEIIEEGFLGVRNAAQRKLLDELGIPPEHIPVDHFVPVGRMLYKAPSDGKWGEHELDYLIFAVGDVEVNPNPDEVADVMYVDREKLKELLKKADSGEGGIVLSPWFRLVVDNFLPKWWDHIEKGTLEEVVDMRTIHKLT